MKVTKKELIRLINEAVDELEAEFGKSDEEKLAEECLDMLVRSALGQVTHKNVFNLNEDEHEITFVNGAYIKYDVDGNKVEFKLFNDEGNEVNVNPRLYFRIQTEIMELLDIDYSDEFKQNETGDEDAYVNDKIEDYENSEIPYEYSRMYEAKTPDEVKKQFFETFNKINKQLF